MAHHGDAASNLAPGPSPSVARTTPDDPGPGGRIRQRGRRHPAQPHATGQHQRQLRSAETMPHARPKDLTVLQQPVSAEQPPPVPGVDPRLIQHPEPRAIPRPAAMPMPVVHRLPIPVTRRQITPRRPRPSPTASPHRPPAGDPSSGHPESGPVRGLRVRLRACPA
jgi:hypothetical protein